MSEINTSDGSFCRETDSSTHDGRSLFWFSVLFLSKPVHRLFLKSQSGSTPASLLPIHLVVMRSDKTNSFQKKAFYLHSWTVLAAFDSLSMKISNSDSPLRHFVACKRESKTYRHQKASRIALFVPSILVTFNLYYEFTNQSIYIFEIAGFSHYEYHLLNKLCHSLIVVIYYIPYILYFN